MRSLLPVQIGTCTASLMTGSILSLMEAVLQNLTNRGLSDLPPTAAPAPAHILLHISSTITAVVFLETCGDSQQHTEIRTELKM